MGGLQQAGSYQTTLDGLTGEFSSYVTRGWHFFKAGTQLYMLPLGLEKLSDFVA
jgi:hypothetical protein